MRTSCVPRKKPAPFSLACAACFSCRRMHTRWSYYFHHAGRTTMKAGYNPHEIEPRWQARWAAARRGQVDLDHAARPFYNLMEFPYPSGEGLHVGHFYSYTGADTYGRYQRMCGGDVFQPIGFDAFGIHGENYALRLGENPAVVMPRNIA